MGTVCRGLWDGLKAEDHWQHVKPCEGEPAPGWLFMLMCLLHLCINRGQENCHSAADCGGDASSGCGKLGLCLGPWSLWQGSKRGSRRWEERWRWHYQRMPKQDNKWRWWLIFPANYHRIAHSEELVDCTKTLAMAPSSTCPPWIMLFMTLLSMAMMFPVTRFPHITRDRGNKQSAVRVESVLWFTADLCLPCWVWSCLPCVFWIELNCILSR